MPDGCTEGDILAYKYSVNKCECVLWINYYHADIKSVNSFCKILTQKYFCINESINMITHLLIVFGYTCQLLPKQAIL